MQGRVRRRGNNVWMVVDGKENVYEARETRRRWEASGENKHVSKEQARPHFCYKEVQDRGVSATCRRCRVEREGIGHKPVPSCARPVSSEMGVWRETPMVAKAREGVIERRLRNHPLDCPVCDQGGECDLQEQTRHYGTDRSRRYEGGRKRSVEDKEIGGQVKIVMTRCIHCTRCVRYSQGQRGIRGRGTHSEIGRYASWKRRENPRSGGRVDRCPVGARTQETNKFADRSWERETVESVNRRDGIGQPVSLTYRGGTRIEVKPKRGTYEIVSNKVRYGRDGRRYRRRESRQNVQNESSLRGKEGMVESRVRVNVTLLKTRTVRSEGYRGRPLRSGKRSSTQVASQNQRMSRKERTSGEVLRGSGVDRERVSERKKRYRQKVRDRMPTYRAGSQRAQRRRHRSERRIPNIKMKSSNRMNSRMVGRDRVEVRPTRVYGRIGRDTLRGVGSGSQVGRTRGIRKRSRDGKVLVDQGRIIGSAVWRRTDGGSWTKKARGGHRAVQIRIHQPNALGLVTITNPCSRNA